jgi:hypothetical protein
VARSTTELVVLIAASAVAVVLVIVTVALVVVADPVTDATRTVAEAIGGTASVFAGIVVGYLLRDRRDSGAGPSRETP